MHSATSFGEASATADCGSTCHRVSSRTPGALSLPTLVMCGEKTTVPDRRVTEILRDHIPQCRYELIPGRTIQENPDLVRRAVRAMAEAVHFYKTNKDPVVKIMQKYSRGPDRKFFEEVYDSSSALLVEDTYPTTEGLKNTLEIQASIDPKAAKAKAEDFVELRFVDELKKSGFIQKLYGKR
jgi:hypothetical protein